VRGGEIYGRMPELRLGGPDDAGFGRIIPTTAIAQYGATLARWFGATDLMAVFPNLERFSPRLLEFMAEA
jgi:uncharacterized protein (DUF1501 family)